MKETDRGFSPALLVLCLIISGFCAQTFGQQTIPNRFEDQQTVLVQQGLRAHMVQMIKSFISQDGEYEYSKHWALGKASLLYGYFPPPSDPPGEYEIFIINGSARRYAVVQNVPAAKWSDVDGSQFGEGRRDSGSGWVIDNKVNGRIILRNDFLIITEKFNDSGTWWHEAQHAAFFLGGDVTIAASTGDADAHHSYIIYYAEAAIALMQTNLKKMEDTIEEINRNPPKSKEEEQNAWGLVYKQWRYYVQAWEKNVSEPSEDERNEYFRLAGVRIPTPKKMAEVYLQGFYKRKLGINPPAWVFSLTMNERTFIWTDVPNAQGQVPETSYLLFDIRSSNGRTYLNNRPGKVTITLELEQSRPKATFAIEVEDGGTYTAIGQAATANGEEWLFDLANDNSSIKSKHFRLALTVEQDQVSTATEMHAKISYGGFRAPAVTNFVPCTLSCTVPVRPQKASVKVRGPVQIKRGDTANLEACITDEKGKDIAIDPNLSPRYLWSVFVKGDFKGNPIYFSPLEVGVLNIGVKIFVTQDGSEKIFAEAAHQLKVVSETAPPDGTPPPGEKPPADKKKPGDKEPGEKTPAEKAPADTPLSGVPSGSESPSSGTTAGGYWKLTDVKDQTCLGRSFAKDDMQLLSPKNEVESVNFTGTSVISRVKGDYTVIDMKQPVGERYIQVPFEYQSGLSWSELPKTIAPGVTVSTTLRLSWSPANINTKRISAQWSGQGEVNINAGAPQQTVQWRIAPPPPEAEVFTGLLNSSIAVTHSGVGGSGDRTYTYTWTPGAMPAAPLDVSVKSDTPAPKLGDTVRLSAQVTGGTAPYTYAWTGAASGSAAELLFTVFKPERYDFIIIVVDAKGAKASAAFSIEVQTLTATIKISGGSLPVFVGQALSFQGEVSSPGGSAPPAGLVYRWQPNPEVAFTPFEGTGNTTTGRFSRLGKVKVWVDVLQKSGTVLSTVAESNQLDIEVVAPEIKLLAVPAQPYPGQEVRITASEKPAVGDAFITYWWEYKGNAINPGALHDPRFFTYKPKDTTPVTVTAHAKAKDGGDDLGQKSLTITARPYDVKIEEPRLMGLPPRVWSEQEKRLVEVPGSIATFQDFFLKVSVSPTPPDPALRYEWTSQPEGCSIYSPGSQETRGNASRGGTFNIAVTVRDNQGATLGSSAREITIVEPTPEPKKAEPVGRQKALDLLKQAQSLYQQDKLNEAFKMAEEAVNSDPANSDASRYAEELKEELQQIKQSLKIVEDLAVNGKLDEAVVELEKVKKPHPGYDDVLRFESTLQDLKKNEAERTKKAEEEEEEVKAVETDASEADAGREKAADLFKQAQSLYQQDKLLEALEMADAAVNSDPANPEAGRYAKDLRAELEQIIQSLNSVKDLVNQGLLSEASAELGKVVKPHPLFAKFAEYENWLQKLTKSAEEKKRVEDEEAQAAEASAELKKAEIAKQQAATQAATEHLDQALSLGKAGRLDEAAAEVAEAKNDDPSHSRIPEFERWILQLRQQREAAANAAERNAADQKAAADRAAEAQAREAEAQAAAEEKKHQEPLPESQGCSLTGEWAASPGDGGSMIYSLRQTGRNISGTFTLTGDGTVLLSAPAQGSLDPRLTIVVAGQGGRISFSGTVAADCNSFTGEWMMEGEAQTLTFRRK